MGYNARLCRKGKEVEIPRNTEGGTYVVGGGTEAELYVTYNYYPFYKDVFPSGDLCWLDGKTATRTIPILEAAVVTLGVVQDEDYWAATEGNAGYTLSVLLGWARLHPDAVWSVA